MLNTKYKILPFHTIWTNRNCWNQKGMNLSKSASRGDLKTLYDPINGLLFGQCKDNKVVLFISTLLLVGNITTMQKSGRKKTSLTYPKTLQAYNKYMGYIVFDKLIGGSFTQNVVSRNGTRNAILE